ncbi:hypothetical protein PR202_gb04239 [Eleusine coracana subsp. coracana]|uniref:S-acyltransferase n=1 Tax=Eleusine coracana subsp. coracana TaxID=191504 RepID=A0AAV5E1L0_ELECO|nr:hypothetical protein PR202_gb04239 [Eleusine coracana subsp. coracana]
MGRPGYVTVPILSVLATIGYVYYTTVFLAIPAWLGLSTATGVANAAAFTALAAASLATYAVAVSRDPGRVPAAFVPDVEDADRHPIHEIKRKDHHCIWINNCVGHENYKIFLVFVLYAVIASIYSLVLIIGGAMHSLPKDQQPDNDSSRTSIIICGVLLCPLALALMVLLGWHVYLILHNKTTIEYHEGVRAMWLAEKAGNIYHHPYDLGIYENLVSVLGPNILCWLCPISRNTGNGVRFRTSYDMPLSTPPK